jgi:hypothetical protein
METVESINQHTLWSSTNSIVFMIFMIVLLFIFIYGANNILALQKIKDNWATYRCNPLIMPFADFFGYNTNENFEFCMGKIFEKHSQPYMGSIGSTLTQSTGILQSTFQSIGSLRNTIASLGGGINIIFQEFTDRITSFFFKMRLSAIHIKTLIGRMYAILFSVMYMGMSGISGMTSFTNTFLFSFLDTFCFPGNTVCVIKTPTGPIHIPIKQVNIGDTLLPSHSIVTATFSFYAKGQPMVQLGSIIVSTNHFLLYNGKKIKAGEHPYAIQLGPWQSDDLLYCLNTTTNTIPIGGLTFIDYDETSDADNDTMNYVQCRVNGDIYDSNSYKDIICNGDTSCGFGIDSRTNIKMCNGMIRNVKDIKIGDKLSTGSYVVGVIQKQVTELCMVRNNDIECGITPTTLYWNGSKWKRFSETHSYKKQNCISYSFVVVPNSQIELENGIVVRDYLELCSPDTEYYYSESMRTGTVSPCQ